MINRILKRFVAIICFIVIVISLASAQTCKPKVTIKADTLQGVILSEDDSIDFGYRINRLFLSVCRCDSLERYHYEENYIRVMDAKYINERGKELFNVSGFAPIDKKYEQILNKKNKISKL